MSRLFRVLGIVVLLALFCDRAFATTMITEDFVFSYSTNATSITLSYSSPSTGNILSQTNATYSGTPLFAPTGITFSAPSGTFSQLISVEQGQNYTYSLSQNGGTSLNTSVSVSPVPLPASSLLFMMALAGLGLLAFLSARQTETVTA